MRRSPLLRLSLIAALAGLSLPPAACALGPEQDPGCHADADCDPGWTCREGACFHVTPAPGDPADAGGGG